VRGARSPCKRRGLMQKNKTKTKTKTKYNLFIRSHARGEGSCKFFKNKIVFPTIIDE
jgi:hypothetical protein